MAGFFPVVFRQYWCLSKDATVATFRLGMANSAASAVIALAAPLLGALSDRAGKRKAFLFAFVFLGIVTTGGLMAVPQGGYLMAGALYVLATIGFLGGNIFYDSLLLEVAPSDQLNQVSALGYALGYMGGGLFFAFCVAAVMFPDAFGFASKGVAARSSFGLTAAWWGIFSIPLFLYVKETPLPTQPFLEKWARTLLKTLRQMMSDKRIALFLIGYWLYIDGVGTIIRMAVDYGLSLGLRPKDLMMALLMTQFIAFPATLLFGKIGGRLGAKRGILIGLAGYIIITFGSLFMKSGRDFFFLAGGVGFFQGGVQSLSRALFGRLVPERKEATYFGVYNMLGRFAAILGPVLMGATAFLTKSTRMGVLSVVTLFIGGICFLAFVPEKR